MHIFVFLFKFLSFPIDNFSAVVALSLLWNFLSSRSCVGGFQRTATKAGFVPYSCTKSMPGKMPTPTCCQRGRPATFTKSNVGTRLSNIRTKGRVIFFLRSQQWGSCLQHDGTRLAFLNKSCSTFSCPFNLYGSSFSYDGPGRINS